MRKINKAQKEDIEQIKKKIVLMEKAREKFAKDVAERDETIKQLNEFNEELLGKMKKEGTNPQFKSLWYKKKKIEEKVSKINRDTKMNSQRDSSRDTVRS